MNKVFNIFTGVFIGFCASILLDVAKVPNIKKTPENKDYSKEFSHSFSGEIKVIDGDSLRVAGKEVRLYGLDAPEYSQNCFDAKQVEYACGKISKEFLFNLAKNKSATCYYEHQDIYHRFLSVCYIDKISINEEIVKNGMAVVYNYKSAGQELIDLEEQAKNARIGIWQGAFQLPKDYRKEHKKTHH